MCSRRRILLSDIPKEEYLLAMQKKVVAKAEAERKAVKEVVAFPPKNRHERRKNEKLRRKYKIA